MSVLGEVRNGVRKENDVFVADETVEEVSACMTSEQADVSRARQEIDEDLAEGSRIGWIIKRIPVPGTTCSEMPPTSDPTTALPFHMPSEQGRPHGPHFVHSCGCRKMSSGIIGQVFLTFSYIGKNVENLGR
jgi:hypothetical protein